LASEVPALGVEGLADYGWSVPKLPSKPIGEITGYPIKDFYLTNAICRASPTMQQCSSEILHGGEAMLEAAE
jgi:NADH-quinone oxidoreductase subunit G